MRYVRMISVDDCLSEQDDMTFEEALKLIIDKMSREYKSEDINAPYSRALRIMVKRALHCSDGFDTERKAFIKNIEEKIKKSNDTDPAHRLRKIYDEMYSSEEWGRLRDIYGTVSRRRIITLSQSAFQRFNDVAEKYFAKQKTKAKFIKSLKKLCEESGVEFCNISIT